MIVPVLAFLAFLAASVAAWAALRQGRLREEIAAQRRDIQADLATQLAPLLAAQNLLSRDLAAGREAQLRQQSESLAQSLGDLSRQLQEALAQGRQEQGARLQDLQVMVHAGLEAMQKSNEAKLEQMRLTVDEKLHTTLDQRLGESFKLVSDRLEMVQRGLGEMQTLAQDVGGLKRVLANVKTRGVLGEAQLAQLLEQFLAPGQFEAQKRVKEDSREAVDFAVRLPGGPEPVWIPMDAKFPLDDYQRLLDAQERADLPAMEAMGKELERRLLDQAKSIQEKYINPPLTTHFAILFLPTEGVYAEVLRRPGLFDRVKTNHQVIILGPTNTWAFLNTIQMGFAHFAISQRSLEVWKVLGEVKAEFRRFGDWMDAVQKKLRSASEEMEKVGTRTKQMERKLKDVHALPLDAPLLPALGPGEEED